MRDERLLNLLDVLDNLAQGYKECAQRIYAAEYVLSEQHGSKEAMELYSAYLRTKKRVLAGEPGLGMESERWNELARDIEIKLADLRKTIHLEP